MLDKAAEGGDPPVNYEGNTLSLMLGLGVAFTTAGLISVMIIGVIFADALTTDTVGVTLDTGFTTAVTGALGKMSGFFTSPIRSTNFSRSRTLSSTAGMIASSSSGKLPRVFESSPSKNDRSISVGYF